MSKQKSIWVIEQGEYSDYRVFGVYDSKEKADSVCRVINKGEDGEDKYYQATVDEWPLNPGVEELAKGYWSYFVRMQRDGTVEMCKRTADFTIPEPDNARITKRGTSNYIFGEVLAKEDKHAIKIMNEQRTQKIAAGEWEE